MHRGSWAADGGRVGPASLRGVGSGSGTSPAAPASTERVLPSVLRHSRHLGAHYACARRRHRALPALYQRAADAAVVPPAPDTAFTVVGSSLPLKRWRLLRRRSPWPARRDLGDSSGAIPPARYRSTPWRTRPAPASRPQRRDRAGVGSPMPSPRDCFRPGSAPARQRDLAAAGTRPLRRRLAPASAPDLLDGKTYPGSTAFHTPARLGGRRPIDLALDACYYYHRTHRESVNCAASRGDQSAAPRLRPGSTCRTVSKSATDPVRAGLSAARRSSNTDRLVPRLGRGDHHDQTTQRPLLRRDSRHASHFPAPAPPSSYIRPSAPCRRLCRDDTGRCGMPKSVGDSPIMLARASSSACLGGQPAAIGVRTEMPSTLRAEFDARFAPAMAAARGK